jgi:hypothetical protein
MKEGKALVLNQDFVVNLQGKDFVTYNGLIDLAHQIGISKIETELIQIPGADNNNQCIFKATVTSEAGEVYVGFGDADPTNVNRMIGKHLIRMAETRAKARALRDMTNVGMTAFEELGGEDEPVQGQPTDKGISDKQIARLYSIAKSKGFDNKYVDSAIKKQLNKDTKSLNSKEYNLICKAYEDLKEVTK